MMEIGGEPPGAARAHDAQPANLNISDVIEAISLADPSYGGGVAAEPAMYRAAPAAGAGGGAGAAQVALGSAPADRPALPKLRILEQPASKALRFRYECEGRSAGSIPGVSSTADKKTYPTIEIAGYSGSAIVVVSCVNKDPENRKYRPHPHNLVGREKCKNGVCTVEVQGDNPVVTFSNLGIQCVKRRDIAEALRLREEIRVDPYKTGFGHKSQPQSIELNAVRLCFQVFLRDRAGKITGALPPEVSDVIYDKKAMSELNIARVSHCAGPATGGTEIILLCEKVNREDIAVVFLEVSEQDGRVTWEEPANVLLVYKQVAVVVSAPPYRRPDTTQHHKVQIQLKRLVDDSRSPPCPFMYMPNYEDPTLGKKRKTISPYVEHLYERDRFHVDKKEIKVEPKADKTPPHQVTSPPQVFHNYQEHDYTRWAMQIENLQRGLPLGAAGPAHMNPYAAPDLAWSGSEYAHSVSPSLHPLSPEMQAMSPNVHAHALSPDVQVMSPSYSAMSPEIQTLPSGMQLANLQTIPPNMQNLSPMGQALSLQGAMSPNPSLGHVSPNLGQVSPTMMHMADAARQNFQGNQQMAMETNTETPSFSGLLNAIDRGDIAQLNSGELSGLVSMLQDNPGELTDSLNRLSTKDLLH